ncbi:U3 small nucleolar RNA-associated protein 12 [Pseudoscourfieldia marina]
MVKAYLRYAPLRPCGLVCSPVAPSGIAYVGSTSTSSAASGILAVASLDALTLFSARTGAPQQPYTCAGLDLAGVRAAPRVVSLRATATCVAVGYADGSVRTFAVQGTVIANAPTMTLSAHRSAVRALAFGADAPRVPGCEAQGNDAVEALLATTSDDTTAAVWDTLGESVVARLKGHSAPVTGAAFVVAASGAVRLLTVSRDGTLRAWDPLDRKTCVLRVRATEHALATLAVSPTGDRAIVAGVGNGGGVSVFALAVSEHEDATAAAAVGEDEAIAIVHVGTIRPPPLPAAMAIAQPRAADAAVDSAVFDDTGTFLVTLSGASKAGIFVYRRRSEDEMARQLKRRRKRKIEKQKKKGNLGEDANDDGEDEDGANSADLEWEHVAHVATSAKPRSLALRPSATLLPVAGARKRAGEVVNSQPSRLEMTVTLTNNAFEMHELVADADPPSRRTKLVERMGHRHGARCMSFGDDDGSTVVTGGHGGIKCWSLERYHALAGGFDDDDGDDYNGDLGRTSLPLTCKRTTSLGSETVTCVLVAPGSRHAVAGTKEGGIYVVDLSSGEVVDEHVDAHVASKPGTSSSGVNGIASHPDNGGFTTCGADGSVKIWEWVARKVQKSDKARKDKKKKKKSGKKNGDDDGGDDDDDDDEHDQVGDDNDMPTSEALQLSVEHVRTLQMDDECLAVYRVGALLAVALLNTTIQVVRAGSLQLAYSLYGHKLPVTCMSCDTDLSLIASGSGDKSLRLWGVDFGDCRRTFRPAHEAGLTAVTFVPQTHHLFTCARDGMVKYWDGDTGEHLLSLPGHGPEEVWSLAVSNDGAFLCTVGQDRSIRVWERTEEPFFAEEEREARVEALLDNGTEDRLASMDAAARQVGADGGGDGDDQEALVEARSARRTLDAMGAADDLVAALELATAEEKRMEEGRGKKNPPPPNPMLLGQSPTEYVLRALRGVRTPDLEAVFCSLPFHAAYHLLERIAHTMSAGEKVPFVPLEHAGAASTRRVTCDEHLMRCASLLVRLHRTPLVSSSRGTALLKWMREPLRSGARHMRDMATFNMMAIERLLK